MANKAISTLTVGSSVYLNVGGVRKEFLVVHQGLPSSLYDASCDGTWLLMKDIYENRQWNSSGSNVYETSTVNTYLNGPFLGLFDSNIQGIIKQVKLPYRKNGGSSGTDQSGANGLSAKIFLLSSNEVGWTTSDSLYFPVDGAKLDYFGASSGGNSKRIAYLNGSAAFWWLRSQFILNAVSAWYVYSDGYYYNSGASESYGIRPALILPSTTLVDDRGNVVTVDLTAHKTLINGTIYDVKGGKCLVNGTVYNILKGRTLIDGTGYDIKFSGPQTWILKENPVKNAGMSELVAFESNSLKFKQIEARSENGYFNLIYYYAEKSENITVYSYDEVFEIGSWGAQDYRTITFEEAPTGDLLTWLQANAVQQ